jgi:uncharacterized protein YecT (DUF1311 family)
MRVMRWIVGLSSLFLSAHVFAAGFDCTKATTATEQRVCTNPALSDLDAKLATTYKAAIGAADDQSKRDLQLEQRHWITFVRNVCDDDACLSLEYGKRIALLGQNQRVIVNESSCEIPEGKSCRSVVIYRDPSYRITSFNQSLKANHTAGSIIGCNRLIDLPVGFRGSNHTFGGYCTLQSGEGRKRVKVCNDDMIGHFALEPISTGTDAELRDFTNDRCYGG